ncbi:MAG: YfiR family protein [Telluria sp.]
MLLPRPPDLLSLRRRALAGMLAIAAMLAHGPVAATADSALERSVKAAFLYKFLLYTEFPASAFSDANAPLVIGVLGADDMVRDLSRTVAGRFVHRRPLSVRALRDGEAPGRLHMLFFAGVDAGELDRVLKTVPAGPMLVVTDADNALEHGSVINFRIVAERVRFDVSLDAADKNNIKLSSRLLTVANHVSKGAP